MTSFCCRICKNKISKFMTFGKMPIANGFLPKEHFDQEYFFELSPAFCINCKMCQLLEQPDPERMFHKNYAFFSSSSKKMAQHFEAMANYYIQEFLPDKQNSFVVELGSNDGIMLRHFAHKKIPHVGIEPSGNVAEIARKNGVNSISEFFNEETALKVLNMYGPADIISASNVICHIPDLHSIAKGIALLLKPGGVFVFEDPYLGDMIQKTSYDQFYDEHVYIFSVLSVINAFKSHGLEVFHVMPQSTHGGSMRYYLCKQDSHAFQNSVTKQLSLEDQWGLGNPETYISFKKRCEKNKSDFVTLLRRLKEENKKVVGYAATSKSTTVLNYCGIGPDLIAYISDTTPLKHGTYSPGKHIPIKPYEEFQHDGVDYAVLFAWNHIEEVFEKERKFVERGGKWITFVPEVKVI